MPLPAAASSPRLWTVVVRDRLNQLIHVSDLFCVIAVLVTACSVSARTPKQLSGASTCLQGP